MIPWQDLIVTTVDDPAVQAALTTLNTWGRDVSRAVASVGSTSGASSGITGASFLTVNNETILSGERRLVAQAPLTSSDGGANGAFTISAATAAPSGGYGTTALAGSAGSLLRSDARLKYPEALMSLANSATFTLSDDGTDSTWTGSLGALNLRPAAFTLSLPRWTGGGTSAGVVGTILSFASLASTLPGLLGGLNAGVTVDDASTGNFFGIKATAAPSASASGLSGANFRQLDLTAGASVNLGGTQTITNRLYIDFSSPRLIGGANTIVTDTGLMQSGSWPSVGVTAGTWTNAYIAKLGFPTVGGTVRRGFWITTGSGNIGTEPANVEGFYVEAIQRGTGVRKTYTAVGHASGTPTDTILYGQETAHGVGTNRWFAKSLNAMHLENPSGIAQSVLELRQLNTGATAGAHINFDDKAGDPPAPVTGDLWRNGDHLWLRQAAGNVDLTLSGGAASLALTEVEKDLGATARFSGTFDITGLAGLTVAKQVIVLQKAAAYTGKGDRQDEAEMDQVSATGYVVDANTIRVYWTCQPNSGPMMGNVKFGWAVSA